jgi:hypothetical protein
MLHRAVLTWWTAGDSNSWPLQCECSALPAELAARPARSNCAQRTLVLVTKGDKECITCANRGQVMTRRRHLFVTILLAKSFNDHVRRWCARRKGWCPRHESNMDLRLRSPLFYPLNYGGVRFQYCIKEKISCPFNFSRPLRKGSSMTKAHSTTLPPTF